MSGSEQVPALALRNLRRVFGGIHAVDGVDLVVAQGERTAIIGPNGAGKSTLFGIISGAVAPQEGEVLLDGRVVTRSAIHLRTRLGLGRSFQVARVFGGLSVSENVQFAFLARTRGLSSLAKMARRRFSDETMQLLREVQLDADPNRVAGTLAHAERKRLELAIVLASEPRILVLDEPTAGMGAAERSALVRLLLDVVEKRGLTLLFTEHDMDVVFDSAERVVVMNHGRIVADGTPAQIRSNPIVAEVYLGSYARKEG